MDTILHGHFPVKSRPRRPAREKYINTTNSEGSGEVASFVAVRAVEWTSLQRERLIVWEIVTAVVY